jgi:hypothetical protein
MKSTKQSAEILDDLFHGCAFCAFVDQAITEQSWPDPEATRRRAYRYYEEELSRKHLNKSR